MLFASKLPTLLRLLTFAFVISTLAPPCAGQQTSGSIRGTISDQLGSLITSATILVKDGRGAERTATTNQSGNYEFRSLAPGRYTLRVVASGFTEFETKDVEVAPGKNTTLDLQLELLPLEQSVTVDNKEISTDSDRNADALILRERDLEALPNDPVALAAALQAMAGPGDGEGGAQR
jgi:uncharacterized surface anchored protein